MRFFVPLFSWIRRCALVACVIALSIGLGVAPITAAPSANAASVSVPEPLPPSRSSLDASAISSEKISQFVSAYLQVVDLLEQREGDLQAAETESESLQMQREIQAEAMELIQAEGLTLQEYLQLLGLANIDPEFGERVAAQLQEATE